MAEGQTRRQILKWIGEFGRESAVLLGVLAPMELLIKNNSMSLEQTLKVAVATLLLWSVGVYAGLDNDDE